MNVNKKDYNGFIKKFDGKLYEVLSHVMCSICHEILKAPTTTKCGHTFCGGCIRRVVSNKNNSGCPLCKCSVNRRELVIDEGKSQISSVCEELPTAFKADVENLNKEFKKTEDDLSGCKTFELGKSKTPQNSAKKGRKPGRPRKSAETVEKINIVAGFVPVVKKNEKTQQYHNKRKEVDDLVSVSQVEERSFIGDITPKSDKLKTVEKVTHEEKINTWFDKAGENLFNVSSNSLFGETSKTDSEKAEEAVRRSSMIRVDYKKEKTNIVDETKDEYEFIASQNTGPKRKRPRRSTSKKKLPDFKAMQHFTKETVKRNQISLNETKPDKQFEEELDEILYGSQKNKSPELEQSSDDLLPDTIKVPTVTASQKFEKLLEETGPVREEKTHILYSSNSDVSLKCTYESEPKEKAKEKEPVAGCSKDSSDGVDILSDDYCLPRLYMTPKAAKGNKKTKPKRKRSNENLPKKHVNAPKKKSRLIEVLQEIKDDPEIVCGESLENLGRLSKGADLIAMESKGNQGNISNLSRSPGWSRVSGLKNDFENPKNSKKQKFKKKSLNVSGGEKTPINTSRSSLCNIEIDDKLDCLEVKNGDDYIDDLSQISEFVTGFSTQQCDSKEDNFKKMVKDMEEKWDRRSSDLSFESEVDKDDKIDDDVEKMVVVPETNTDMTMIVPETESPREESEENFIRVENVVEELPGRVEATLESTPGDEVMIETIDNKDQVGVKKSVETPEPVLRFNERRRNRKTIPFTLLGKIKKRKRTSTIFLQLGRLAPFIKKSKSTVVKLVFPKGVSYGNKRRKTSIGVQTFSEIATHIPPVKISAGIQTSQKLRSEGMQTSQVFPFHISPIKISAGIQTSQRLKSEGMQTTQREFDNTSAQTSQVAMHSTGVQMTQKNTALSAGVQTTQIEKSAKVMCSAGVQMTQISKGLSAGVQTSQVMKTANVQTTQSLLEEKEQSLKSKDLFPSIPSEALDFDVDKDEWEKIENLGDAKITPEKESSGILSTQSKLEKFVYKSRKPRVEEEPILMDTEIESEFNTTWDKISQKKSQRKLSEYFTRSSDSDDVPVNRYKHVRRISSQDLSSQEEVIGPDRYEGRQLLPLNVEKVRLSETIDIATPEPSQKNTQELLKRVYKNIDKDLAKVKDTEVIPIEENESSQESVRTVKSQIGEDSDTDIFVEQTPPKETSRILDISVPRATQNFTPPPVMNLQNTEGTEVIADSIPPKQIGSDSVLMLDEKFVTPTRSTPKTMTKAPIFKTPYLGFPSKESFFNSNKKETEEPDENDQNMINNEGKSSNEKTVHARTLVKSWTGAETPKLAKRKICIVTSCCRKMDEIQKFVDKFNVEFSPKATKDMTHLVVGLHDEDKLPMCTPKLLFAMANKKWVVSEAWIETCLKLNMIVKEEPFESTDSTGGDGCKIARLSKEPLLKDFEICTLGEFNVISKEEFADLVLDCGAKVVHHPDKFSRQLGKIRVILVDRECLELDINQIQELFKKYKTAILYREVIIQSIEGYKLVNFTPYLLPLITEKDLLELGYPEYLARHEEDTECI